jgi:hypothetical protein
MEVTSMKTMEERVSQLEKSTGAPATDGVRLHAEHASTEIAELTVALGGDAVTFHDVARAWFGAHDEKLAPQERSKYRGMFPDLLAKFTSTRGGIESDYFCEHIKVAAVLTDIDQAAESLSGVGQRSRDGATRSQKREHASASAIYIEPLLGEPSCWESKALLSQALDLHDRALEFLRPEHRKVCVSRIFRIITWTLGTLDNRAARTPGADVRLEPEEATSLKRGLDEAEAYYRKHADGRARLWYVAGMLIGMIPLFALLGLIALLGDVALDEPIFVSLFAGGIGAIVSVMTRVTRGNLALEREISKLTAVLLGGVRPFIGAIFGGLLFVLIEGNVISIAPGGTDPTFVTYAGLAFIAGFSERIAKSAIETAEDTITGDAEIGADAAQPSAKPV